MGGAHGNARLCWVGVAQIERVFGVSVNSLKGRDVRSRTTGSRTEFELADFWSKCRDLVYKRMHADGQGSAEDLKSEKLAEEIRKIRIANDQAEGLLVRADEVEAVFSRAIKAMADELDAVVSRVKMAAPDIPQSALAVIAESLAAARRKAARIEFDDSQDETASDE